MSRFVVCILISIFFISTVSSTENGLEMSLLTKGSYKSFGYNYFNNKAGFEIAVPMVYQTEDVTGGFYTTGDMIEDRKGEAFNIDVIYRRHFSQEKQLSKTTRYWYYGGLARYTYLKGILFEKHTGLGFKSLNNRRTTTKLGVGINIGYKTFFPMFNATLYWGWSISMGRYLSGRTDVDLEFRSKGLITYQDDGFIDVELSKFGYVF